MNILDNSEIERWVYKSKDTLDDARILVDYGKETGHIPKIYYSILYSAKALLLLYGKRHKRHSAVIGDFGKIIVKEHRFPKRFGRFFNKMFDLREKVDYSDSPLKLKRRESERLLKSAESFIGNTQGFIAKNKFK